MVGEDAVMQRHKFGAHAPLAALHGVYGTGHRFGDFAWRLDGSRVVAPDLRGHGGSLPDPSWRLE
jgi:pimeloyl-ACP methyl ester carboxylesterase